MHVTFVYRNHREKIETRHVSVHKIEFLAEGVPDYDYKPGVYLTGYDLDRSAIRTFSFDRMIPMAGQTNLIDFKSLVDREVVRAVIRPINDLVAALAVEAPTSSPKTQEIASELMYAMRLLNI